MATANARTEFDVDRRVLIVDDSAVARAVLRRVVEATSAHRVARSVANASAALEFTSNVVEVVLLDIDIRGSTGWRRCPTSCRGSGGARHRVSSAAAKSLPPHRCCRASRASDSWQPASAICRAVRAGLLNARTLAGQPPAVGWQRSGLRWLSAPTWLCWHRCSTAKPALSKCCGAAGDSGSHPHQPASSGIFHPYLRRRWVLPTVPFVATALVRLAAVKCDRAVTRIASRLDL